MCRKSSFKKPFYHLWVTSRLFLVFLPSTFKDFFNGKFSKLFYSRKVWVFQIVLGISNELDSLWLMSAFKGPFFELNSVQKQPRGEWCSIKKRILKNFIKFTGKHLRQRLWHRCFPVNFVKFLRAFFYRTPLDYFFCQLQRGKIKLRAFWRTNSSRVRFLSIYLLPYIIL